MIIFWAMLGVIVPRSVTANLCVSSLAVPGPFRIMESLMAGALKEWKSFDEQVELFVKRGLIIDSSEACKSFLQSVNYYHFSGYFRFWQIDPSKQINHFLPGTSFDEIRIIYERDQHFALTILEGILKVEQAIKTRFAYEYGRKYNGTEYLSDIGFDCSDKHTPIRRLMLRELQRSKEQSIAHYRVCKLRRGSSNRHYCEASCYPNMPIWVGVEALSFGTVSRAIGTLESEIFIPIAHGLSLPPRRTLGIIRSIVELRNRCAHGSRLWNFIPTSSPGMSESTRQKAKNKFGSFWVKGDGVNRGSVFAVLIPVDYLLRHLDIEENWLREKVMPILKDDERFCSGITHPQRYGEWKPMQ